MFFLQDAHLQPEFQLSGGDRYSGSAASAVLGGMVAPPPSSFGVNRPNDREAIFGGPMSPQHRNPVAGSSYLDSEDKRLDGSEEFINIKVTSYFKIREYASHFDR